MNLEIGAAGKAANQVFHAARIANLTQEAGRLAGLHAIHSSDPRISALGQEANADHFSRKIDVCRRKIKEVNHLLHVRE